MEPFTAEDLGKSLFEETGDALFLFDPQTEQILDANPMAEQLTDFTRQELLGQPVFYFFRSEVQGGLNRLRLAAQKTAIFHSQEGFFLRTRQDGGWVPVNLTLTRLHLRPGVLGLITARDVQEQRATHLELRKVEGELRRVLASIPDCLWSAEVDGSGQWLYRYFSPVVSRIAGQPPEFFLGNPQRWRSQIHPEDRSRWEKAVARLKAGRPSQEEYRILGPDGAVRWVRDNVLVSRAADGRTLRLDGVLTDITESKRASEELDRFFNLSIDMLCTAGFDGYFKRLNPAWEQTLGWTLEELMSRPYIEFVHPDDRAATLSESENLAHGGQTIYFENRYQCSDGAYKWLLWTAAPYPSQQVIYAAAHDITERKQSVRELEQKAAELTRLYRQAQLLAADLEKAVASERQAHSELKKAQAQMVQAEKLVALGQMVAGVAHEINNPLAFVTNNLAVLQRDVGALRALLSLYQEADATLAKHQPALLARISNLAEQIDLPYTVSNLDRLLDRSREGVRRIQQIVKDLRGFARLDESDLEEVNLNEGIESTINVVRGRAIKKNVELELDLAPLPPVLCYPAKINQVVLNLVANAIDASSEGGKVVTRTRATAAGVEIHVIDHGHGIAPVIRNKIFDPFFTTKPPGKGTGLGLSISHGIAADHGGRIEVESTLGQGTHFTVYLPFRPPPQGSEDRSPARHLQPGDSERPFREGDGLA